jgi:hypothetical protein
MDPRPMFSPLRQENLSGKTKRVLRLAAKKRLEGADDLMVQRREAGRYSSYDIDGMFDCFNLQVEGAAVDAPL